MLFKNTWTAIVVAAVFLVAASGQADAQDGDSGIAPPESMPPEIAELFEDMAAAGADIAIAPSEAPMETETPGAAATAGNRYLYTTLRVTTNGNSRGCGYANWNCMTNLCRRDLRDTSAWRGWAGCWKRNSWICYFECGQRRNAF